MKEPGCDTPKFEDKSWTREAKSERRLRGRWKMISHGETAELRAITAAGAAAHT